MTASPQCTTGKEKQRGFSKLDCLVKHSTKFRSSISISVTNSYWLHQLRSHPLEEHLHINGLQNIGMSLAGNLDKEHNQLCFPPSLSKAGQNHKAILKLFSCSSPCLSPCSSPCSSTQMFYNYYSFPLQDSKRTTPEGGGVRIGYYQAKCYTSLHDLVALKKFCSLHSLCTVKFSPSFFQHILHSSPVSVKNFRTWIYLLVIQCSSTNLTV